MTRRFYSKLLLILIICVESKYDCNYFPNTYLLIINTLTPDTETTE